MAGDWLKIECATPDKAEVHAIALELGITRAEVVGCLFMVWRWFDQQTETGNAPVTLAALDMYASRTGFAAAMAKAGWLSTGKNGFPPALEVFIHNFCTFLCAEKMHIELLLTAD